MTSNTRKLKYYGHLILRPTECSQIHNLAHYKKKRFEVPGIARQQV